MGDPKHPDDFGYTAEGVIQWQRAKIKFQADEIERLRAALAVIYRAHEKVLDEGDAWFITDDTTVGYYICSVLGAPPEEKE